MHQIISSQCRSLEDNDVFYIYAPIQISSILLGIWLLQYIDYVLTPLMREVSHACQLTRIVIPHWVPHGES